MAFDMFAKVYCKLNFRLTINYYKVTYVTFGIVIFVLDYNGVILLYKRIKILNYTKFNILNNYYTSHSILS